MSGIQKTTVYLDAADYRRLKAMARARGCAPAELVREAVARYAASEAPPRRARSVVIATAARVKATAIATLDLRHFAAVTIPGSPKLLPRDL